MWASPGPLLIAISQPCGNQASLHQPKKKAELKSYWRSHARTSLHCRPPRISPALKPNSERFQDCSGFSGRAFSCHQSPAPEIETQQIRCWEQALTLLNTLSSSVRCQTETMLLCMCVFLSFFILSKATCAVKIRCGIWFMDVYGHPSDGNPVGCGLMPIPNFWPWHVWADPCGNELLQKPVLHSACIQHRLCLQASGPWALKSNVCYRLLHWAQLDNLLGAGNQEIVFINFHSRTHCKWIQII